MKKCVYCGKELKTIFRTHKEYNGEITICIENTPILTCDGCKEEYFNADTMDKIREIISYVTKNKEKYTNNTVFMDYNKWM